VGCDFSQARHFALYSRAMPLPKSARGWMLEAEDAAAMAPSSKQSGQSGPAPPDAEGENGWRACLTS